MSSTPSEARQKIVTLVTDYLNSEDASEVDVSNEILCLEGITDTEINNTLWTFFTLCKSERIFGNNAIAKIGLLVKDLAEKRPELVPLVFLCLDVADWQKVAPRDFRVFGKSFKQISEAGKNIPSYVFQENPEGYSRLLCALLHDPIPDLKELIGEHNLNVDSVLMLFLDIVGTTDSSSLYDTLKIFPLDKVVKALMQKIGKEYKPGFDSLLFYLFDSGIIPENQMDVMMKRLAKLMDQLWAWVDKATTEFCEELRKPITVFPGETKEDTYSARFKERRANFRRAVIALHRTPKFRYLLSRLSIPEIRKLARFDPCSVEEVAQFVLAHLKEELAKDRENFLNEENMELLCMLSCHCSDNMFITSIASMENVPPHIYSYFLLPCLAASDCAWQLSWFIKQSMDRFSLPQKCQIFEKYAEAAERIVDLRIITAKAAGVMARMCKRLTEESAKLYALKIAKLFLRAPHVIGPALLQNYCDNTPPVKVPMTALSHMSLLGVEMMIWTFIETIKQKRIPHPGGTRLSAWPQDIALLFGMVVSQRYQDIDLNGLLRFIEVGLSHGSLEYIFLFEELITQMTDVRYRGADLLSKNDIKLRSGSGLLWIKRVFASSNEELLQKTYKLKEILTGGEDNTRGLRILSFIDAMHNRWFLSEDVGTEDSVARTLDKIRFVFLTCCELLDCSKMSPCELMKEYGFSLPAALHITRGSTETGTESLSPATIPPRLFGIFWDSDICDLHVPEKTFQEWEARFDVEIEKCDANDEEKKSELELRKMTLQNSREKQRERVNQILETLRQESSGWFDLEQYPDIYTSFVEQCVFPRAIMSLFDSVYCWRFIYAVANFSTSFDMGKFLDAVMKPAHFIPFSATQEETTAFGRFLCGLLKKTRDRQEERGLHDTILEKIKILLRRPELSTLGNTVWLLDKLKDFFPKFPEHRAELMSLVEELDVPKESDVGTRLQRYKPHLKEDKNQEKPKVVLEAPTKSESVTPLAMTKSRSKPLLAEKPVIKPSVHSDEERPVKSDKREPDTRKPTPTYSSRDKDYHPKDSRDDYSRRGASPGYDRRDPGYSRHDRTPPYDRWRDQTPPRERGRSPIRDRDPIRSRSPPRERGRSPIRGRTPPRERGRSPIRERDRSPIRDRDRGRDRRDHSPPYRAEESRYRSGRR